MKSDLRQRGKNIVRHVMSIMFLHNDKLNHRSSSGGVVGADEPLQWGRAPERARMVSLTAANCGPKRSIALAQFSMISVHNCRIGSQSKTNC